MPKKFRFALSILTAFFITALSGGVAQAAPVVCSGVPITADIMLEASFTCPSDVDGFVIGANDVTVDLNGFTITGSGGSSGVFNVTFDNVTIKNGAITGFQDGIRADFHADNLRLMDLAFSNQRFSSIVIINSTNVKITDIFISLPAGGGVPDPATGHVAEAIRLANVDDAKVTNITVDGGYFGVLSVGESQASEDLKVEDSVFVNVDTGIRIINSINAKVQNNFIVGTDVGDGCYDGIDIVGLESSNLINIVNNDITGCAVGIFAATDSPSTELAILGNNVYGNGDGIYLMHVQDSKVIGNFAGSNKYVGIGLGTGSTDNKILRNTATGNGIVDMFHVPTSTPNKWSANTCGASDGNDIDCP